MGPSQQPIDLRRSSKALPADQVVGRVVTLGAHCEPKFVDSITGGLTLEGVDVLEAVIILHLINRGQPRTEFM